MPTFKCPKCGANGSYYENASGFGFSDYNEVNLKCPEIRARMAVDGRTEDVSCSSLNREIMRLRERR
jgi:hypothetical protein